MCRSSVFTPSWSGKVAVTVGIASVAVAVIGTGVTVMGQMQAADAAKANADYQAQVAKNNQITATQNANYALQAGRVQEQAQRQKEAQTQGAIRAAEGANGLDVNSGSNAQIQVGAAEIGEQDALTVRNTAARRAYGYQTQASDFGATAGLDQMTGSNAQLAGYATAGGSLLSGASSVAQKWSQNSSSGVGSP